MKNSEIAEGAIEVLEQKGWIKGTYYEAGVGYCLLGAGAKAMGLTLGDPDLLSHKQCQEISRVMETFTCVTPRGMAVYRFNDDPTTTYEDVVNLATKAAKYWRDRGE